jgi:hypothetical protein
MWKAGICSRSKGNDKATKKKKRKKNTEQRPTLEHQENNMFVCVCTLGCIFLI